MIPEKLSKIYHVRPKVRVAGNFQVTVSSGIYIWPISLWLSQSRIVTL